MKMNFPVEREVKMRGQGEGDEEGINLLTEQTNAIVEDEFEDIQDEEDKEEELLST